jgi:hypothetical protein
MKVLDYSETVMYEDPLVVLIEETVQYEDGGPPRCTYTVYMGGERVITSISGTAVRQAISDMIDVLEFAESNAS